MVRDPARLTFASHIEAKCNLDPRAGHAFAKGKGVRTWSTSCTVYVLYIDHVPDATFPFGRRAEPNAHVTKRI